MALYLFATGQENRLRNLFLITLALLKIGKCMLEGFLISLSKEVNENIDLILFGSGFHFARCDYFFPLIKTERVVLVFRRCGPQNLPF